MGFPSPAESEREEGEIIEVIETLAESLIPDHQIIEYEEISSDEEFNLRQRIGELEARNQELEKIASISSTKASDYGLGYDQHPYIHVKDISDVEEIVFDTPTHRNSSSRSQRKADRSARRRKESGRIERRRERSSKKQTMLPPPSRHQREHPVADKQRSRRTHRNIKSRKIDNSSSDEDEYRPTRDELRAALLTSPQTHKSSSLKAKLKGIQDTVTELIDINSPGENEPDDVSASIEILEILDTLTEQKRKGTPSDEEVIRVSDESNPENETSTLEEQELRLVALKTAILKKHEARKQRKAIDSRPYSPTDAEILFDTPGNVHKAVIGPQNTKIMRNEPENMDISPAISPALQDKTLQHVDMDLASDDENAMDVSAVDEFHAWIPLPAAPTSISLSDRNQFAIFQTSLLPPPPPPPQFLDFTQPPPSMPTTKPDVPSESSITKPDTVGFATPTMVNNDSMEEDEDSLRAMLLAKSAKPKISKPQKSSEIAPAASDSLADSSMEAEQLRNLLLQSLANKTPKIKDQKENRVQLPAVSLKAAVKRIKASAGKIDIANGVNLVKENIPKKKTNIAKPVVKPIAKSPVIVKKIENANLIAILPLSSQPTTENVPAIVSVTVPAIAKQPLQPTAVTKSEITAKVPTTIVPAKTAVTAMPAITAKKSAVTVKPTGTVMAAGTKSSAVITKAVVTAKPVVSAKPAITTKLSTKRKAQNATSTALENAKKLKPNPIRSKLITNWNPKQIPQFFIRLDESDSDSDDELDFNGLDAKPTDADRFFDNASPASIAMDSPKSSPASPMTITNDSANNNALPLAFEQKLDIFLKSVRNNEDVKKTIKVKEPIVFSSTPTVVRRPISTVPTTPLVVRHLPEPAQDEYRRLIDRMNQLETKRAIAKRITKPLLPLKEKPRTVVKNITKGFTIILPNPNPIEKSTKRKVILKPKAATVSAPKAKSLVKELLVKNVTLKLNSQQQNSTPIVESSHQNIASEGGTPTTETIFSAPEVIPSKPEEISSTTEAVKSSLEIMQPYCLPGNQPTIEPVNTQTTKIAPNKSPPLETLLLNMSPAAKSDLLKIHEDEFTQHSNEFLDEMNDMHRSVCEAQQTKRKQLAIELHLERLRAQVAHYETALTNEKDKITILYPRISASRQNILKRRKKCTELSLKCQRIGVSIFGISYRPPADFRNRIVDRLKDISCETKILKGIRNTSLDATSLPPIWSYTEKVESACQTDNFMSESSLTIESLPMVNNDSIVNVQNDGANCPPDMTDETMKEITEKSVPSSSIHSLDSLQADDTREVSSMETAACKADVQCLMPGEAVSEHDIEQAVQKYQSPLDHMQHKSSGNPDAVICPFQLMGQCEDKECSYRHLR